MKTTAWQKRERRVRIDLVKDLIRLDLLECKPITHPLPVIVATRPLPDVWRAVAEAPTEGRTKTMATEPAQ